MEPPLPNDIPSTRPGVSGYHLFRLTHELGENTLNRTTSQDGESVASVRSDDSVISINSSLHTDRDGLLTNSQVTESSDQLLLVQGIGGLLHSPHGDLTLVQHGTTRRVSSYHLSVQLNELVLADLDLWGRGITSVRVERFWVQLDLELGN
jgi:hypothetical protein